MKRILIVAGALTVVVASVLLLPRFAKKDLQLPKTLGTLQLQEEIRGERANTIINNMHGKRVTPRDNMIATYESNYGTATVYLSVYENKPESEKTFQQMVSGIQRGTGPFTDLQRQTVYNHDVAFCVGFGQAHYFFVIDESVYWLTADFAVAEEAVNGLLAVLRSGALSV